MNILYNVCTFFIRSFIFIGAVFYYTGLHASFEIIEVMPNTLDDKNQEYIKIKNTSSENTNIESYYIEDVSGKQHNFKEIIFSSGEEQIFYRTQTKIILNNSNETLSLYTSGGILVDEVSYSSSIKGKPILFGNTPGEEEVIEDETGYSEEIEGEGEISGIPEVVFDLQRPSYITQSGSSDMYICDNEHDECKVNFDLRESFSSEFPERDYSCEISFGSGRLTEQDDKCNPNTMSFDKGEHEINFRIFHKGDRSIFSEKVIHIIHSNEIKLPSGNEIAILRPEIIVQSGLEGKGRYFYCEKAECKINLKYEKRHEDEECRWKFHPGTYSSLSTRDRCNPGYVTFPEGVFELYLKVYQDGNRSNSKKLRFYVYNTEKTRNYLSKKDKEEEEKRKLLVRKVGEQHNMMTDISQLNNAKIGDIDFKIELQGKIGQEKYLSGNILECRGVEKCYVNFEGIVDGGVDNLSYIWKNNGEEFSQERNPKGFWVDKKSDIELIVLDGDVTLSQETFAVDIVHQEEENIAVEGYEPVLFAEEIEKEKNKEEQIDFTQNFLILKYDGLRISGKAPVGSRVELYQNQEKILSGITNDTGKYRLVSKTFSPGNYQFDTKLISSTGEEIFLENSGQTEITHSDIAYWYTARKSSRSRSSSFKIPQLIVQAEAADVSQDSDIAGETPLIGKIFMSFTIALSIVFGGLHLILRQLSFISSKNLLSLDILQFSTRQKILLLVA